MAAGNGAKGYWFMGLALGFTSDDGTLMRGL